MNIPLLLLTIIALSFPLHVGAAPRKVTDQFNRSGKVEEAGSMGSSSSASWWVNSGGRMLMKQGSAWTVQNSLSSSDRMRRLYAQSNPTDTDNGTHPQNIFRLIRRDMWANSDQRTYVKIHRMNFSASPNRAGHNGVLLMSRYRADGQTLYYAGLRVDGNATIKKKVNGRYVTLAHKNVYGNGAYNAQSNPNLLPLKRWLGVRLVTKTNTDGSVSLKLYTDLKKTGKWKLTADVTDRGQDATGRAITETNHTGIRTDFLDAEFGEYKITAI